MKLKRCKESGFSLRPLFICFKVVCCDWRLSMHQMMRKEFFVH
jgi:hypothetical protein